MPATPAFPRLRRLALPAFIFLCACLSSAAAGPVSLTFPHPDGLAAIRFDGYQFDDREESIRVIDEGSIVNPAHGNIDAAMRASGALAGVNGGFFAPDSAPLGLMVADGKSTGTLSNGALTSGVLFRTTRSLQLLRTREFTARPRKDVSQLLQAGPFLVDNGALVTGLDDTKSRVRTIVIHDMKNQWLLGCTSAVTLADLGRALANTQHASGIPTTRALNLDGGSSSALWIAGTTKKLPWKPVRNYLAVVKKLPASGARAGVGGKEMPLK